MGVIYYFSGTGNTLAVAQQLAALLGDTEICDIAATHLLPPQKQVGLAFPVHFGGVPAMADTFLHDMAPLLKDAYVYLVLTCGKSSYATVPQVRRLLKQAGVRLCAAFVVRMPSSYLPLGGPRGRRRQQRLLRQSENRLKKAAEGIRRQVRSVPLTGPLARAATRLMYPQAVRACAQVDRQFSAGRPCRACGQCERLCPAGNIRRPEGYPVWQGQCQSCLACIQWCPEQAIRMKGVPERRRHYHHPGVRAETLIRSRHPDDTRR